MAYNDPPYTFMGPDADKVLKGIFTTTPLPVVPEPAVDAGLSSPVTKTAKGYPNIGLSTTPPPVVAPTVQTQPATATPPVSGEMAKAPKDGVPVPPDRFSVKLGNGMTYTSPAAGQRTFTMGTPGQDGYGIMTALGRTGPADNPNQVGLYSQGGGGLRTQPVATPVQPIQQGPADKSPLEISMENLDRLNASRVGGQPNGMPQYLGPETGLGWKVRLGIFKEQMDAYKQGLANQGGMQVAGLRETGDMARAGMQAASAADQTAAVRERTGLEGWLRTAQAAESVAKAAALQQLNAAGLEVSKYKPGTPEYNAAVNRYQALNNVRGTAEKPNIQMLEEPDPLNPILTKKVPAVMNADGTYTRMQERVDPSKQAVLPPLDKRIKDQEYTVNGYKVKWNGTGWDEVK